MLETDPSPRLTSCWKRLDLDRPARSGDPGNEGAPVPPCRCRALPAIRRNGRRREDRRMGLREEPHPLTESIPPHLEIYLSEQDYSLYTPMDQAGWRFIMAIAQDFYGEHAHRKYLDGLRETGISVESIPRIEEMDRRLRKFQWRAVPVIGFIPPAAFLEFQSLGLLPIACDMRKIENLNYTPAPDIVHEAAGHAPIIADPAYAAYLRSYGEVARRAIFSKENMNAYYAIRRLSDTKERPDATAEEIREAEENLERRLAELAYDSEVDWVTRLGWWTTEYGLVGTLEDPQIYGAGLLSSIGESYHALTDQVRKIPLDIDCIHQDFNITEPQPQLFVTPDFDHLIDLLEELADRMAFRRGGAEGLAVAKKGRTVCTVEFDSGLQVSGVVSDGTNGPETTLEILHMIGPTQIAYGDSELDGNGPQDRPHGYLSPIGPLEGGGALHEPDGVDLREHGFSGDRKGRLAFASGLVVEGRFAGETKTNGRRLLLRFEDCTVRRGEEILHRPEQGPFDLACGAKVESVYGNAADRHAYLLATGGDAYEPGVHKTNLTDRNRALNGLYGEVREIRESGRAASAADRLEEIHRELEERHPRDWLLRWELLELAVRNRLSPPWRETVRNRLAELQAAGGQAGESIERGLLLLDGKET
ncbi:MAG: aromatic amino acid hydroxylase [Candidatus Eisenbacteria bacterium]|nr:aromatic amino acid hydroxylase [Candidatus Latescibacterota bacterium]MBD3301943.1 aromatic amino acid hydroxylase [Candidatus Eisenbacteria bacterium]